MELIDAVKARHAVRKYTDKAMNQQKFKFALLEGNRVKAESTFSLTGKSYLNYDLGIVKCHFEIGAGREQFTWI